jgi:hypothetical protein
VKICYIDESGGFEPEGSKPDVTPLMVIAGLVIDHEKIGPITTDFLRLKQVFYPGSVGTPAHVLDYILAEVKGTDLRRELRSNVRDKRRHAIGFLDKVVALLDDKGARIIGRIWVKQPGTALDRKSTYTYAIQDLARHFQHLLSATHEPDLMILDSRMHHENREVSHSVFTMKHRLAGDSLPNLVESPVFGVSDNHAGLQLADLLAGAFLFPMACMTYCQGSTSVHITPRYLKVGERYAQPLSRLRHLYKDGAGRTKGGIVVSDRRGHGTSRDLFRITSARPLRRIRPAPRPTRT